MKEWRFGESFQRGKALAVHNDQSPVKEFFHSVKVSGSHSFTKHIEETTSGRKKLKDNSCYCLPVAVGETFERFYTFSKRIRKTKAVNRKKSNKKGNRKILSILSPPPGSSGKARNRTPVQEFSFAPHEKIIFGKEF